MITNGLTLLEYWSWFLNLSNYEIYYFDFDGVLVNSIDECLLSSKNAFDDKLEDSEDFDLFFREFRYLVNPANEYITLCNTYLTILGKGLEVSDTEVVELFNSKKVAESSVEKRNNLNRFFRSRLDLKKRNIQRWLSSHLPTDFLNFVLRERIEFTIVTTKDRLSTMDLCNFFNLAPVAIYSSDDVSAYGSKAKLINKLTPCGCRAVFLDDSMEHLRGPFDNNITPMWARWGYTKINELDVKEACFENGRVK